jgi:flagellar L-ring protein precursor FlgH
MTKSIQALGTAVLRRATLHGAMAFCALFAGCATTPDTVIKKPSTPAVPMPIAAAPGNGSIFQLASYRPIFEDRRARLPGDALTINIVEKTTAAKDSSGTGSKTGSTASAITKLFGIPSSTTDQIGANGSTANKYEDKGATSSSNTFTGAISVTVSEVLPNGYLVVSGEKQVALDKGAEFIRFSGVVNPDNIISGNQVPSSQVSDARIEYRTNTRLDPADMVSSMAKFFLSVLPF